MLLYEGMLRPPRLPAALLAGGICTFLAVSFSACLAPTQLTLELRTDVPCSSVRGVSITVGSPGTIEGAPPSTTTNACNDDGNIGTIAVAPAGSKAGRIAIRAILGVDVPVEQCTADTKYLGCIVVRRELSFVPRTTSVVPIGFYLACRNVACDGNSTCKGRGQCVGADEEPGKPKPSDAGMPPLADGGSYACSTAKDCPVLATDPPNCTEAFCNGNECGYASIDADKDGERAANCQSQIPSIQVKLGTDCDDNDATIASKIVRACNVTAANTVGACKPGRQTCDQNDPRKIGPCEGEVGPQAFNCNNGLDNDCNGTIDANELVVIPNADKANICANLYVCPQGTVQPTRLALCRTDGGVLTLDCATVPNPVRIGYAAVSGLGAPPANTAWLLLGAAKTTLFPSGVSSSCCPSGSCAGQLLCDSNVTSCGVTLLSPPL